MKALYITPRLRSIRTDELSFADQLAFETIKYIDSPSEGRAMREAYVTALLGRSRMSRFCITMGTIPRTFEPMDMLVVGGNNPEMLADFMKDNLGLCRSVPRICLANDLPPDEQAVVLMAGFDDIILTERTGIAEAEARLVAVRNRYRLTAKTGSLAPAHSLGIEEVCKAESLTPVQGRIVGKLCENYRRAVSCESLIGVAKTADVAPSVETLRVQISKLRRLLRGGFYIESIYSEGYRLRHIKDPAL